MTRHHSSRLATFLGLFLFTLVATAFVQARKFPGGTFKAYDGENNIAITFDTTGSFFAYVNGEGFSQGTWESRADTLLVGALEAPEGYGCPAGGRYLWSIAENTFSLKVVNDECQLRLQYFTGLTWTKG
ncbi:MAG TPA: hypothetical protein VF981_09080 [Gemmatimonadaceae bacterium]